MKRKYKMRKIKPVLRKIRKAFIEMWRQEHQEVFVTEEIMRNLLRYREVFPIDEFPKQELVYIPEKDVYVDRYMQNGKGELFKETDILRKEMDICKYS